MGGPLREAFGKAWRQFSKIGEKGGIRWAID